MWEKEHLLAMVAASPSRCAVVELMLIFLGFGFVSLYHAIDINIFIQMVKKFIIVNLRELKVSRCVMVWCGVVWCDVVWCGVVWCGVLWCGVM